MAILRSKPRIISSLLRRESLPQRPLVVVAGALVTGCVAGPVLTDFVRQSCLAGWLGAALAVTLWAVFANLGLRRSAAATLVAAVFLTGVAWSAARANIYSGRDLAWQLDETPRPIAIGGTIAESPQLLSSPADNALRTAAIGPSSQFVIAVREARWHRGWAPCDGKARVVVSGGPIALAVGAEVRVYGRGLRPSEPLNPGELNVARRARDSRQLSIVRVKGWESVTVTVQPRWWSPATVVDSLRTRAASALAEHIGPERSDLAAALLVGQRDGLGQDVTNAFLITGTIHVLSISGLHVALLAIGLFASLGAVGVARYRSSLIVAAVIGGYMVLVGAGTPVVRATILVWVACGAISLGRRAATINSLAIAAMVVCVWQPAEVFSVGAQLSFLSTGVLVGVTNILRRPREDDPIEVLIERSRTRSEKLARRAGAWATNAFIASAAVTIATGPLVASCFHVVSLVGLVANVVVGALVPVAMACGFLCLLAAPVSGWLAWFFGMLCDSALALMEATVSVAASVPGGHLWVPGPPCWWVFGWYTVFALAMVCIRRDLLRRMTTWGTLAATWSLVGVVGEAVTSGLRGPEVRVVMAAVGHGCGIVVTSPLGRCLVYDAGRLGAPGAARRSLESVLWSEGITRIDTLVISHGDSDHFNAVPALLTRFQVGELLVPKPLLASQSASVTELITSVRAWGVPIRSVMAGHTFAIDPLCRARVLHPSLGHGAMFSTDNEMSLVLAIEAAGRRVLLTGDLEATALAIFNASNPGPSDVLVAPHHGSPTTLPATIAAVTKPQIVLVSGRGGRHWPEVQSAYAAAAQRPLEAVLNTGREGALAVRLTAAELKVERFTTGRWRAIPVETHQADGTDGRVAIAAKPSKVNWLATYMPSESNTPLVNP